MKKILLLILILFVGMRLVNAKDDYKKSWVNDNLSIESIRHMTIVSDGVLVGGVDSNYHPVLIKLDRTGKEVKKLVLDYEGIVSAIYEYKDNYYLATNNDDENWETYIYRLDKDLKIVKSSRTGYLEEGNLEITNLIDDKLWITTTSYGGWTGYGAIYEDELYLCFYIDLDDLTTGKGSNQDIDKFTKSQQALILASGLPLEMNLGMSTAAYSGHGFTIISGNYNQLGGSDGYSNVYKTDDIEALVKVFEENVFPDGFNNLDDFSVIKNLGHSVWYKDIVETEEYVIGGGNNYQYLDFYDFDGKFVNSIDLLNYIYNEDSVGKFLQVSNMVSGQGRLYVSYQHCDAGADMLYNCKDGVLEIKTRYNIETKVTNGKGTIKAINVANSGDEIIFEVIPEKGYILGEVKVTDSKGNVVIFKDYKFTMPSADVLIEVTFVKEETKVTDVINPETIGGASIALLGIVLIVSLIVAIVNTRKARDLM